AAPAVRQPARLAGYPAIVPKSRALKERPRRKQPRSARFSFCCSEGNVRHSRLSANIQDADDVFIRTGLIATNYDRLFPVQLKQTFEQIADLRHGHVPMIYHHRAVGLHINDDRTEWHRV